MATEPVLIIGAPLEAAANHFYDKGIFDKSLVKSLYSKKEKYQNGEMHLGEVTYKVLQKFGQGIKGQSREEIEGSASDCVSNNMGLVYSFVPETIKYLRDYETVMITGTPAFIAKPLCEKLGIDSCFATEYPTNEDGIYTGRFIELSTHESKTDVINKHYRNVNWKDSIGFGDDMTDLSYLDCVGTSVVIDPKNGLGEIARNRGWPIFKPDNGDAIMTYLEERFGGHSKTPAYRKSPAITPIA